MNEELILNNKEKAESTDIVNIVSTFSKVGVKERTIYKKNTFVFGIAFGIIMLFIILLKQMNSYLIHYKEKI